MKGAPKDQVGLSCVTQGPPSLLALLHQTFVTNLLPPSPAPWKSAAARADHTVSYLGSPKRMQAARGGGAFASFQTHTWPDADCTARSRGPRLPQKQVTQKSRARGSELGASAKAENVSSWQVFQNEARTLASAELTEATWGDRRWTRPSWLSGGASEVRAGPASTGVESPCFPARARPGQRARGTRDTRGRAREPASPAARGRPRPSAAGAPRFASPGALWRRGRPGPRQ